MSKTATPSVVPPEVVAPLVEPPVVVDPFAKARLVAEAMNAKAVLDVVPMQKGASPFLRVDH